MRALLQEAGTIEIGVLQDIDFLSFTSTGQPIFHFSDGRIKDLDNTSRLLVVIE